MGFPQPFFCCCGGAGAYAERAECIAYCMAWQEDVQKIWGDLSVATHVWAHGCLVEGHRGLLQCTPTVVVVRRKKGCVEVQGEGLRVHSVTRDEVWVEGCVKAVVLHA